MRGQAAVRAVIQRVTEARVRVGDRIVGEIGRGLLVLLGVARDDGPEQVRYIAGKIRDLAKTLPRSTGRILLVEEPRTLSIARARAR